MTVEYVPTTNLANILQGAPQSAAVIVLDEDGSPQPVVAAFQAMSGGTDAEATTGSCYLALSDNGVSGGWYGAAGNLNDDPARIILSLPQPKEFAGPIQNTYYPGAGSPFTIASLLAAFGPVTGEGDGLISGPNEGDVPTNVGSPVALVTRIPTPGSPPVLVLVHGVYVDHERNRVLLSAF
jgi:hypothetical protein